MFKLELLTGSDAFQGGHSAAQDEIGRILRDIVARVYRGDFVLKGENTVRDMNGNRVGSFTIEAEE